MAYSPIKLHRVIPYQSDPSRSSIEVGSLWTDSPGLVDKLDKIRAINNRAEQYRDMTTFRREIRTVLTEFYEVLNELALKTGIYHSIDPFSKKPLRFSSKILALCDISYRGFNLRMMLAEKPSTGSLAESTGITVVVYRGAVPDFMSAPRSDLSIRCNQLSLTIPEEGYLQHSSEEALATLRELGVDPVLFMHYAIHEFRHNLNFGRTDAHYRIRGNGSDSVFLLPNSATQYQVFDEATAYLTMVADGPNVLLPLARMLTLVESEDHRTHHDAVVIALNEICNVLGEQVDIGEPEVRGELLDAFSSLSPTTLRKMAAGVLRSMYYEEYRITDSNAYECQM